MDSDKNTRRCVMPLKELEAESTEMQPAMPGQLFASLPRRGGGWRANHALQRPAIASRLQADALVGRVAELLGR